MSQKIPEKNGYQIRKEGIYFGMSIKGKRNRETNFLCHVFGVLTVAVVFFRSRKKAKHGAESTQGQAVLSICSLVLVIDVHSLQLDSFTTQIPATSNHCTTSRLFKKTRVQSFLSKQSEINLCY